MIHDERVLQMLEEHDEVFQISFNVFGPLSEQDTHVLGMGAKLYTDMIGDNNTCIAIVEIVDERLARATNSYIAHHFTFYSSVLLDTEQQGYLIELLSSGLEHLRLKHEILKVDTIKNVWS